MSKIRWIVSLGVLFCFIFVLWPSRHALTTVQSTDFQKLGDGLKVPEDFIPKGQLLSLDEVTRLALAKNLEIQMSRVEKRIKDEEIPIAKAVFDTHTKIEGTHVLNEQQNANIVLGNRERESILRGAIKKKISLGTDVGIQYQGQKNSIDTSFSSLNPNYSGQLEFQFQQPLLKNFFGYIDRKRIQQVELNVKQFRYEKLDDIEEQILTIRSQYWDLVFAYANLKTREKALQIAQAFFVSTQEKLELGLTEKPDVYAAEANVRRRVIELREALTHYHQASFVVKVSLNRPEISLIQPSESFAFEPESVNYENAMRVAFQERWDLKKAYVDFEEKVVEFKIAKNQKLPDLVVEGAYRSTSLDEDLGASQGEIFGFNHPRYFIGAKLETPLERRAEKAEYRQASLHVHQAETMIRKLKLEIEKELDNYYRRFLLSKREVVQYRKIEALQRLKLEEELRNFQRGRSESKTMIDYQEDVINAEIDAINAWVDYRRSWDAFKRAQNQLLKGAGVIGDDAVFDEREIS